MHSFRNCSLFKTMICLLVLILSLSLNLNINAQGLSNEQLNIAVFYESKCPDSARFINRALPDAIKFFPSYLNIILVPFGKANVNFIL